jgi:hypothetical protein
MCTLESGIFWATEAMAGGLGTVPVATHSVIVSIHNLIFLPYAISTAASIRCVCPWSPPCLHGWHTRAAYVPSKQPAAHVSRVADLPGEVRITCNRWQSTILATEAVGMLAHQVSHAIDWPCCRVGNLLGANRPYAARMAAAICVAMAVALMLAAGGAMLALRDRIAGLFTNDAGATEMIASMIPFLAAFEVRCVWLLHT